MLHEKELQELLAFRSEHPVVTVYLNTDPREGNADAHRLRMRSLLKGVRSAADAEAIRQFFEVQHDWSGRGVAVFSCQAEGFFRAYPVGVPVRDMVWEGGRPYVRPLTALMDAYGHYGVVLVNKEQARFLLFHLGWLEEQDGFQGEEVRRTKRGSVGRYPGGRGSAPEGASEEDEVVERNMKQAVAAAEAFFSRHQVRRILIGGSEENVALFRERLGKAWQSLIAGTFPMDIRASHAEVLAKALEIGQEAERRREERLVGEIRTLAAKGGAAVVGLDETLGAVHEKRVRVLVYEEGYRAPGYVCTGCGFPTVQSLASCPFCGSAFEQVPDAVELAVRRTLEEGGDVEVIPRDLSEIGHVGALLRY